ncbi:MAG: YitT family protein, partial [Clostridia bacterium]|nr:YitT family protein [Clostridia bacterium]
MKKKIHPELSNILYMVLGLFIAAMAYNLYLIPNNIAAGGFTGVGQLLHHFVNINVGTVNIIMNVPLFLLSMKSMGLRFGVRSLIAMFGFSLLIDYIPMPSATNDMLLAAVYGGLLSGVGFGFILRGNT